MSEFGFWVLGGFSRYVDGHTSQVSPKLPFDEDELLAVKPEPVSRAQPRVWGRSERTCQIQNLLSQLHPCRDLLIGVGRTGRIGHFDHLAAPFALKRKGVGYMYPTPSCHTRLNTAASDGSQRKVAAAVWFERGWNTATSYRENHRSRPRAA